MKKYQLTYVLLLIAFIIPNTAFGQQAMGSRPDQIAMFQSGNQSIYEYMQTHIKYPKKAKKEKLEGKVLVGFTVTKEGTLTDIHIKNSSDSIFNESAIDLIKSMKKWQPAMKDGQPVDFKMALPISYRLKKE